METIEKQRLRRILTGVGLLFLGKAPGERKYLGSCFSVVDAGVFVTAAHCLKGLSSEMVWINPHGGPPPDLFTNIGLGCPVL